ncbi:MULTISPECIES: N-acetylmuramoyl-L-alanine amidase [unclassified Streptomyces]|uniref:N-acetylmuramoyl-L-alanine amidase n=1 Tax=unclassified Streptomyces TaxID=2593676 RepID=UPI00081F6CF1|nr:MULTISPECIES: N-acetylmuramoyl-L-alanine amidase [unclassified Streptomyces]MYZ35381.1 N-acetylmuramoyl-L-alanine amidase [Streptomyces sp. SID4917]SCF75074.1 N-acetylmuramoyl-L-alanine amidase [Streptomyces sp. MnatMP-M17]
MGEKTPGTAGGVGGCGRHRVARGRHRGAADSGEINRRTVLIGGAAALLGGGVLAHEKVSRLWWRVPGIDKPRTEGELDYARAQWIAASPANWRRADRPDDYVVDRVVIHVVQGSYQVALKVFRDPAHGAASHYVVRKDGHVAQMIRELDVAYHAGNRAYNERSIGIEHEGWVDRKSSFTDAMYRSSARLTAGICARYEIPVDREHIIGHVEVPGTDHTDPGPYWDWDRYMELVREAGTDTEKAQPGAA